VPIIFSDHAKFQLKKRKIPEELVKKAVLIAQTITSSYRGRKLRRMLVDDKLLEVITRTEGSKIIVITGYYLK